jgi:hypothetical protein
MPKPPYACNSARNTKLGFFKKTNKKTAKTKTLRRGIGVLRKRGKGSKEASFAKEKKERNVGAKRRSKDEDIAAHLGPEFAGVSGAE